MGADGHIDIWNAEKVRQQFPNADELFGELRNIYKHELGGVEYYHGYYGDNVWEPWGSSFCVDDGQSDELRAFIEWLENNTDANWEVWT